MGRRGCPALPEVAAGRARGLPPAGTDLSPDQSAPAVSARGDTARTGAPHHHGAAAAASTAARVAPATEARGAETRGKADTAAGAYASDGGDGQAGRRGAGGAAGTRRADGG